MKASSLMPMPEISGGSVPSVAREVFVFSLPVFFLIYSLIRYYHLVLYLYYEKQICNTRELLRSTFIA